MWSITVHDHRSFRSCIKISRVLKFSQSMETHFSCYELLFSDGRWCHKCGKSFHDSLIIVGHYNTYGNDMTLVQRLLRWLLWYMTMPDTENFFCQDYARWTKCFSGRPTVLKTGINPVQITLPHSLRRADQQMWSLLCSLLGLTSRSARFVLNYATVVGPLQALLHNNFSFLGQLFLSFVFNQLNSWTVRN